MIGLLIGITYWLAVVKPAPNAAAWQQLDMGIGLPSVVIIAIIIGACAAVLRDRLTHSGALFGTFFTSSITTITFMHFVGKKLLSGDPAAQAVAGLFLAYNAQKWAGKFTNRFIKGAEQNAPNGDPGHD